MLRDACLEMWVLRLAHTGRIFSKRSLLVSKGNYLVTGIIVRFLLHSSPESLVHATWLDRNGCCPIWYVFGFLGTILSS